MILLHIKITEMYSAAIKNNANINSSVKRTKKRKEKKD